jgi:hypothetical protein
MPHLYKLTKLVLCAFFLAASLVAVAHSYDHSHEAGGHDSDGSSHHDEQCVQCHLSNALSSSIAVSDQVIPVSVPQLSTVLHTVRLFFKADSTFSLTARAPPAV